MEGYEAGYLSHHRKQAKCNYTNLKNYTVIKYASTMESMYNALNHLESIHEFMPKPKEECEPFSEK